MNFSVDEKLEQNQVNKKTKTQNLKFQEGKTSFNSKSH